MKEKKTSEAQRRASKAWAQRNREKASRGSALRTARAFIRNKAELSELDEFEALIQERRVVLQEKAGE
uniref:hypothetical protein n=1 Tax=Ndongobacter massiliensis TaxID=1871025 RepID=UPI000930610F|nr:hypothetical protein [Ndongobacter massiliensis]